MGNGLNPEGSAWKGAEFYASGAGNNSRRLKNNAPNSGVQGCSGFTETGAGLRKSVNYCAGSRYYPD